MQNLIAFLQRHGHIFTFLLLEVLFLGLYFQFNSYPRAAIFSTANAVASNFYNQSAKIQRFFLLSSENEKLAEENARLRGVLGLRDTGVTEQQLPDIFTNDSSGFQYRSARTIENSVKRATNFITINKGRADGVELYMGVINTEGVVGIVSHVTEHYSAAVSLLNVNSRVSASLKGSGSFGTIVWDGMNSRKAALKELNVHVKVSKGDSVVTSGYSGVFPRGIMIGIVDKIEKTGESNFYVVDIELAVDFGRLDYLYLIKNPGRNELDSLQQRIAN